MRSKKSVPKFFFAANSKLFILFSCRRRAVGVDLEVVLDSFSKRLLKGEVNLIRFLFRQFIDPSPSTIAANAEEAENELIDKVHRDVVWADGPQDPKDDASPAGIAKKADVLEAVVKRCSSPVVRPLDLVVFSAAKSMPPRFASKFRAHFSRCEDRCQSSKDY